MGDRVRLGEPGSLHIPVRRLHRDLPPEEGPGLRPAIEPLPGGPPLGRQVPVHLPAKHGEKGRIYRMDYLVNVRGGENVRSQDVGVRFLDVKGRDTQASAAKRSFASNYLPRPVELVKRLSNGGYDWPR